jgi:hypothetical protein
MGCDGDCTVMMVEGSWTNMHSDGVGATRIEYLLLLHVLITATSAARRQLVIANHTHTNSSRKSVAHTSPFARCTHSYLEFVDRVRGLLSGLDTRSHWFPSRCTSNTQSSFDPSRCAACMRYLKLR